MKTIKFSLLLLLASCAHAGLPPTRTVDVVDEIHGVRVADPYRWLEQGDSEEVQAWADAQNARTRSLLDSFRGRSKVFNRIKELNSMGRVMDPKIRGDHVFYKKRQALENQPKLYVREGFDGEPRVLLDPNTMSADATVAIDWWVPTPDGTLLAYGTSPSGSEISTLRVLDVHGEKKFTDEIPYCRAASIAWLKDNSGFYYTRYPKPGEVPEGEEKYHRKVYLHTLGTDPAKDPLIWGTGRAKEEWPGVGLSPDNKWLMVAVFQGWSKSELYLKNLETGGDWVTVIKDVKASSYASILNDRLIIYTNDGAPRNRIMVADLKNPGHANWKELIPQSEATIDDFEVMDGHIVTRELHKAFTRMRVFDLNGKFQRSIDLPTVGTVYGTSTYWNLKDLVFDFQSFFTPPGLYRFNVETGRVTAFEKLEVDVDTSKFEAKQVEYPSKDGTKVTMFVIHRRDMERNGDNPTLLYGYGGFNISLKPGFSGSRMMWLEHGGVVAIPNLRGGGEYGEDWHKAGMLGKKQNTFDDFIAAAEYLIEQGYTSSSRLAIAGGSNGGLLVGACMTQRPDLYKAVICSVPLLDMVRYHKFLIARLWIPEYGTSDKKEDFQWLHKYSPYHNVKEGTSYPATLIMTADTDTRVDPLHARKMAALLQASTGSDSPILLRVEKKAGHGAGKPFDKVLKESADQYCFLMWQLGISPK